ncbi:MAG TPA: protein kinase [Kofleriaceae bacterium]
MPASRYQILGHLASGGMGEIWLARRVGPAGFEKLVVLKRPLGATTPAHVTAVIDEARLLARINHPNVCQVHDLEEGEAGYFLVLEYLDGLSWWALLVEAERAGAPLEPGALCGMVEQVCDGLDAIHAIAARDGRPAGIVHRDISPGNLFLTEAGVAKILDLGIAKTDESNTTAPGAGPRGKLPYLSPEQVAGRAVDRRVDVFSLGLVLYDLARGRPPEPQRVGALAAPELALDTLPAPLAAVIRTAVAIDPAERFATAGEMAAAVRTAGRALGGSLGRVELARWLRARFGAVLAARQAQLHGAATAGPSIPRRVELRSLVRDAAADAAGEAPGATHATAELPAPPPLIHERAHPAIGQVQALVVAGGGPVPRRPARRGRVLAALAIVAGGIAAAAWWWSGGAPAASRPEPATEARSARSVPAPAGGDAVATTAPAREPSSSSPTAALPERPEPAPTQTSAPPPELASTPNSAAPPTPPPIPASTPTSSPPPASTPTSAAPPTPPPIPASTSAPPPAPAPAPTPAAATPDRPAVTSPRRPAARLTIDSDPFAIIDLDGKPLGATPLYQVRVAPGRHVLRAETGDGRVQRRAIDVTPGTVATVVLRWTSDDDRRAR